MVRRCTSEAPHSTTGHAQTSHSSVFMAKCMAVSDSFDALLCRAEEYLGRVLWPSHWVLPCADSIAAIAAPHCSPPPIPPITRTDSPCLLPATCPHRMQVVLITPPTTAACEVSLVNRMFQAGLPCLHLRKPTADTAALRAYLQDIQPQYLDRIVLHQHHNLTRELPLKGIHYKERDRPQPPLPRFSQGLTQSTSVHSLQEVSADWQNLDYAFLSPIFDSISKEGYTAAGFDQHHLADALQQAQMPVYALGGVSLDKVPVVRSMGFQGIGLLGAVWGSADPVAALQEFQDAACNS